jgi:hypothetical protein
MLNEDVRDCAQVRALDDQWSRSAMRSRRTANAATASVVPTSRI